MKSLRDDEECQEIPLREPNVVGWGGRFPIDV